MDPISTLGCRLYQIAFRIALPVLPYRRPVLLEDIEALRDVFLGRGIRRVLLVTDPSIYRLELSRPLQACLEAGGVQVTVYHDTSANPTTDDVEAALALYKASGCQGLIGFGGGSSMDCAKAVGARVARPDKSLSQMEGILKVRRRIPLLAAVPTTAGTGSETTLAAVITDAETRHKYPINDFPLIPSYALLDPEVTVGLPPMLTATTGMDALTHAVEAYIGRSTTRETRRDAVEAVRLVFTYLPRAVEHGEDREARRNMLHAAYLAGNAFTRSYVGYVHGIAHSLGGKYDIPHGLANAVLLPFVLEAYGPSAEKKLARLAEAAGLCRAGTPRHEAAQAFIRGVKDLKERFGIPDSFPELREEDIPQLARYAARESNPLYPVPREMDAKELEALYHMVMEKGDVDV